MIEPHSTCRMPGQGLTPSATGTDAAAEGAAKEASEIRMTVTNEAQRRKAGTLPVRGAITLAW